MNNFQQFLTIFSSLVNYPYKENDYAVNTLNRTFSPEEWRYLVEKVLNYKVKVFNEGIEYADIAESLDIANFKDLLFNHAMSMVDEIFIENKQLHHIHANTYRPEYWEGIKMPIEDVLMWVLHTKVTGEEDPVFMNPNTIENLKKLRNEKE